MTDGFIQAPADGIGKRVDADQRVNSTGTTVYRLRVKVEGTVSIRGELLELILAELQLKNRLLAEGLGVRGLENLRKGESSNVI